MTQRETDRAGARFLALAGGAQILNVSQVQAYALVRSGDLPAVKIGGRGRATDLSQTHG